MKNRRNNIGLKGYLFILPALFFTGFIYFNPIIRLIWFSLKEWDYFEMGGFNGFANYIDILNSNHLGETLLNNLIIIIGVVPLVTVIAVLLSQFIYFKIFGYKFYSFLFFVPVVIPDLVVAKTISIFLNKFGPLNTMFQNLGLDFLVVDWIGNPRFSIYTIMIAIIWKTVGFAMILFLARLTTVDYSIYEAAKIDGASDMQMFRYISIPILKNIIQIFIILQFIGLMTGLFGYIHLITGGGPGYSSTVLEYFVYLHAFRLREMGTGSAAGVIMMVLTAVLIYVYLYSLKRQKD